MRGKKATQFNKLNKSGRRFPQCVLRFRSYAQCSGCVDTGLSHHLLLIYYFLFSFFFSFLEGFPAMLCTSAFLALAQFDRFVCCGVVSPFVIPPLLYSPLSLYSPNFCSFLNIPTSAQLIFKLPGRSGLLLLLHIPVVSPRCLRPDSTLINGMSAP